MKDEGGTMKDRFVGNGVNITRRRKEGKDAKKKDSNQKGNTSSTLRLCLLLRLCVSFLTGN